MAEQIIWTWQDVSEYLHDVFGLDRNKGDQRQVNTAILRAYDRLANEYEWVYYTGTFRLDLVAEYSEGSLVYDHTGGSKERLVTLTGGTWPTWAAFGRIHIGDIPYRVATRESDTELTFEPSNNPGADVASTSYRLTRLVYPLPLDCRRITHFADQERQSNMIELTPSEWEQHNTWHTTGTGFPFGFTFLGSHDFMGARSIGIAPAPTRPFTYNIVYQRWPQQLRYREYSRGTVTVTNNSATVTSTESDANWEAEMVGSVIRISASKSKPTGRNGEHPFAEERTILSRTDANTLILDDVVTFTGANLGYVISDTIDVDPRAMIDALLACCQERLTQFPKAARNLAGDREGLKGLRESAYQEYIQALVRAKQADRTSGIVGARGSTGVDRFQVAAPLNM